MIRPPVTLLVAGAAVVLLALMAVWQLMRPDTPSRPAEIPRTNSAAVEGRIQTNPDGEAPREADREAENRPLFRPGRRSPATAAVADEGVQTQSLETYTVLGIVAAPARATALIRGPDGQIIHLRAGQTLAGWTLETITPKGLIFASGGLTQELAFKTKSAR